MLRDWRASRQIASRWLYPLVLLVLSTCYCFTERGLFLDDWYYMQRSAADGTIESLILERPIHFWRPIYRVTVSVLITACSDHLWIAYCVAAMVHGGVALLLWRLVRTLGAGPIAAAVGALLFLVWPAHFEAVLWISAIPTVMSAGFMACAWNLQVDSARGTRRGAAYLIPICVGLSVCSNEQAACGIAVLPAIYFASIAGLGSWRAFMGKCILPATAGGMLIIVYMAIHKSMGLPPPPTADGHFTTSPERMIDHIKLAGPWIFEQSFGLGYIRSALVSAGDVIREHPRRAVILGLIATFSLKIWADRMGRDSTARAQVRGRAARGHATEGSVAASCSLRSGWVFAAALLAFIGPMVPIIVMCYWMVSRVMYAPNMAIPLVVAASGSLIERMIPSMGVHAGSWMRVGIAHVVGGLLLVPAGAMVGFQHGYVERTRQDEHELSQLHALVPDPEPWSVFVPVYVDLPALKPGRIPRFDHFYWSPFHAWWSARWAIRATYKRDDLLSAYGLWHDHGLGKLTREWCTVRLFLGDRMRWEKLIPFSIDNLGNVHVITEVAYEGKIFPIPQTQRIAAQGRIPKLRFDPLKGYSTP
jgi:hypothetical protein